ncbi:MAG: SDR family NAD(P)-dependent oxidoreductase [Acidimicrobiales bacterium]|jgi:dehydrogenase/reductase SDR family protein 1
MANVLEGRVALVTGASKNIGKGIAIQVAASGATTYVTARSLEDTPGALASLERTVAEAEAAGGRAIAVACDHGDDEQVASVFRRIVDEQGRLDLVVNVASPDFSTMVGVPFWELPFDDITRCLQIGPRSDYVTTALAARVMLPQGSGLIVNVSSHGAEGYLLSVPYGVGKAAIDKITRDTALELKPHGVAVVSLWPGLVLTEGLLSQAVVNADGTTQLHGLDLAFGETPAFNGKAVVALASDRQILERTGGSYWSSRLAREYGFAEDDGSLPPELVDGMTTIMDSDDIPAFWRGVDRFAGTDGD